MPRAVALDLDGTLFNSAGTVTERTRTALRSFVSSGGVAMLAAAGILVAAGGGAAALLACVWQRWGRPAGLGGDSDAFWGLAILVWHHLIVKILRLFLRDRHPLSDN